MNSNIIIYDFDGTLTPVPTPNFEILEYVGIKNPTSNKVYIDMINKKIDEDNMNLYEAIYNTYLEVIKDANVKLTNDNISMGSNNFEYNNGVVEFLEYTKKVGIKNYIVSSSIKVLLDETKVASYFEDIYATTFNYDDNKEAISIDYLLTDRKKVEVIKKILKDNNLDNCNNIIYIGDGLTDYYAMEYVEKNGGKSIYIYYDKLDKNMEVMKNKNVVSLYTQADFRKNSEIYNYINKIFELK